MDDNKIISLEEARKKLKNRGNGKKTSGTGGSDTVSPGKNIRVMKPAAIRSGAAESGLFEKELMKFKASIGFNPLLPDKQLALGNYLLEKRKEHLALEAYQAAVRLDPERWEPWFNAGLIYLNVFESLETAQVCFENTLALNPGHAGSYLNLSIISAESGALEEACEILETALQTCPKNVDIWNNLGVFLAKLNRRDEALKAWEEAIRISPHELEAYFNRAVTYSEMRMYDAALMCYRRCLKYGRVEPEILLSMAELYEIKGDYANALKNYRRCLKIEPGNIEARRGEAVVHVKAGDVEAGKTKLREILSEYPRDEETLIKLGLVCASERDFSVALNYFMLALDKRRLDPDLHFNIGTVFEGMESLHKAVDHYAEAVRLNPSHQEGYMRLGNIFLENNEPEKALEIYRNGLTASGDSALLAYSEGRASRRLGRITEAIHAFKRAVSLEPAFVSAYFELGALYYEKGQKSKAIYTFQKVLELDEKNHVIRVELGVMFYEAGRIKEARRQMEEALKLRPDYPKGLYYLGLLELENGQLEKGMQLLQECCENEQAGDWAAMARDAMARQHKIN